MRKYEELKLQIKKLEEEAADLKDDILSGIPHDKVIETQHGKFYVQIRSKWTFSLDLQQKQKQVKELEKEEKATGKAVPTETPVLYYEVHK